MKVVTECVWGCKSPGFNTNDLYSCPQSTADSDSCNESTPSSSSDLLSIKNTFLHFRNMQETKKGEVNASEPIGKYRSYNSPLPSPWPQSPADPVFLSSSILSSGGSTPSRDRHDVGTSHTPSESYSDYGLTSDICPEFEDFPSVSRNLKKLACIDNFTTFPTSLLHKKPLNETTKKWVDAKTSTESWNLNVSLELEKMKRIVSETHNQSLSSNSSERLSVFSSSIMQKFSKESVKSVAPTPNRNSNCSNPVNQNKLEEKMVKIKILKNYYVPFLLIFQMIVHF
jgi:hypothetical protein